MTGQEAIEYLNNSGYSTWKLGLERTRELVHRLGDPQKQLKFVHVAGTNGKGSTCAMTANILQHAGYKTGLYPSPYIEDFCERIQINGVNISYDDLGRITEKVAEEADAMEDHPSQFELITAVGLLYFAEQKVDIVVLEVGLGGEFDSTNIIDAPLVAVICNIGLDHTEYLGDTVEKIAETKCGIVKPGSSVVTYDNIPSVIEVIKKHADAYGDRLYYATDEKVNYKLSLIGSHQRKNAAVVLAIIHALRDRGYDIPEEAVVTGLATTVWPARFEVLSKDPLFILDGGHNPQCAQALVESIEEYLPGQKVTFLMGMLADKDYRETLDIVIKVAAEFVTITPDSPRALPGEELAEEIEKRGFKATPSDNIKSAIDMALEISKHAGRATVAFGSLYSAGAIRSEFLKKR